MCFLAMPLPLLLVSALVFCTGEALGDIVSLKIQAIAGETVILPCTVSVKVDAVIPSVEWSKEHEYPTIAFLYRDGCETFEEKNPTFQYRTNLFLKELERGNASLRLSNVQLSDAGEYKCKTMIKGRPREVGSIELSVGAVSEPKLSVVSAEDRKVTLQCEANCLFPKPEITFLDAHGNIISDENTKTAFDFKRDCFNITGRVTVQAGNRVTCRVHQHDINQTRDTEIYIRDEFKTSCTPLIIIAVIEHIILCAIFALLYKTGVISVGDNNCFLRKQHTKVPQTEEDDNGEKQTDQRKIRDLEYKLNDQEEIIRSLNEKLDDFGSKQSPVVFHGQPTIVNISSESSPDVSKPLKTSSKFPHNDNPTPAASTNNNHQGSVSLPQNKDSKPDVPTHIPAFPPIQKGKHNHSSPALLTKNDEVSPSSPSASSSSLVQRSMSMSESGSRSNGAKPQRRNTFSYPFPIVNRFSLLENLPEDDSMPLLE
ncbi:erythroid membrane-associated protein-like isoform X1 [Trematomus bernacchii]|uniref:erythroid membrane-associated protein-like isoform X1 n=1 Tax=Trematomus bernacchii TaxID=40690 RepID=UPI00146DFEC2|nr:erythroid membrane-associated protein-like isoform X1 [Trematomus bernacchii]